MPAPPRRGHLPRPPLPLRLASRPGYDETIEDDETRPMRPSICGYQVGPMLGRGGLSTVFAADSPFLDLPLAMKVVTDPRLQDEIAAAAIFEHARTISTIASPHVVRTIGTGRLPTGEPFVVMERAAGEDLATRLARTGPLPVGEALALVQQACRGLAAAHAAGVVHGDVKPPNLVVGEWSPGAPRVVVIDFSPVIPNALDPDDPLVTFTLGYAAPEQLTSGAPVDARADVFSLGVVLHELVSGTRPFPGTTMSELVTGMRAPPPLLVGREGPVSPRVARIVAQCLAPDPARRFPDARALGDAIDALWFPEPVVTERPRASRVDPELRRTLLLAALGPASALVSLGAVRLVLALLR